MLTVRPFCRELPRGRRCFRDASSACLARAQRSPRRPWQRSRRDGDPAARAGLEPRLNGRDLDDPPAADQRRFELAAPDRAPDSPVLTSRHRCHFLDGQVRTAHDHINRLSPGPPTAGQTPNQPITQRAHQHTSRFGRKKRERRSSERGAVGWRVLEPPIRSSSSPATSWPRARPHERRRHQAPCAVGDWRPRARRAGRRDADRSRAEAGAIRTPCVVVDLHSRHPITRRSARSCARCSRCRPDRPTYTLSTMQRTHSKSETVCCERSERQTRSVVTFAVV